MDRKLSIYNYTRNRDKLLSNLVNIIEGMTCDGQIDAKELLYLDTWLLESEAISENYCVQVLRDKIAAILEDGVIEDVELQQFKDDLLNIQQNLLDTPNVDFYSTESDKHLLEGLCKGMLANHELTEDEIRYLHWWLSNNGLLKTNFPGKDLYLLIENILADGVVTPDEREELKEAMIAFTGCDLATGSVDGLSIRSPLEYVDELKIKGSVICLTGNFLCGSRSSCVAEIEAAGGIVIDDITQKLDYLIIGTLSSRDWRYQSYGRKIEKAIEYREKGHSLKIISEEHWRQHSS